MNMAGICILQVQLTVADLILSHVSTSFVIRFRLKAASRLLARHRAHQVIPPQHLRDTLPPHGLRLHLFRNSHSRTFDRGSVFAAASELVS